MTCFPAHRRDLACRTCSDDEVLIGPAFLPDLPEPGPVGRVILALFEGGPFAFEHGFEDEVEIIVPPPVRLH